MPRAGAPGGPLSLKPLSQPRAQAPLAARPAHRRLSSAAWPRSWFCRCRRGSRSASCPGPERPPPPPQVTRATTSLPISKLDRRRGPRNAACAAHGPAHQFVKFTVPSPAPSACQPTRAPPLRPQTFPWSARLAPSPQEESAAATMSPRQAHEGSTPLVSRWDRGGWGAWRTSSYSGRPSGNAIVTAPRRQSKQSFQTPATYPNI